MLVGSVASLWKTVNSNFAGAPLQLDARGPWVMAMIASPGLPPSGVDPVKARCFRRVAARVCLASKCRSCSIFSPNGPLTPLNSAILTVPSSGISHTGSHRPKAWSVRRNQKTARTARWTSRSGRPQYLAKGIKDTQGLGELQVRMREVAAVPNVMAVEMALTR